MIISNLKIKQEILRNMKIVIVKLSALGDIVHCMVVLQFIKKHAPYTHIDWITEESLAPILEHHPHIDDIKTVNLKSLKHDKKKSFDEFKKIKKYSKENYDLVIDAQGLIKSAIVSRLLGKKVAGFAKDSIREPFASLFYNKRFSIAYEKNVIERNCKLVSSALGFEVSSEELTRKSGFLYFAKEDQEKIKPHIKKDKKNIVFILGSSWESKVYPKEKFLKIAQSLSENILLCWGNEKERKSAELIAKSSDATVLPKLNLNELKALIGSSDLVIGGDSGPTHMAWAMNRPSITIFGPTPSSRNTLKTDINLTIDCKKDINPLKLQKDDLCIRDIDEKEIVDMAKTLLGGDLDR